MVNSMCDFVITEMYIVTRLQVSYVGCIGTTLLWVSYTNPSCLVKNKTLGKKVLHYLQIKFHYEFCS